MSSPNPLWMATELGLEEYPGMTVGDVLMYVKATAGEFSLAGLAADACMGHIHPKPPGMTEGEHLAYVQAAWLKATADPEPLWGPVRDELDHEGAGG